METRFGQLGVMGNRPRFRLAAVLAAIVSVAACVATAEDGEDGEEGEEGEEGEGGGSLSKPDDRCASGVAWAAGERESSQMYPGRDCVACHSDRNEAEEINLAGTVYAATALNDPDDCFGVADVEIVLTGADGQVVTIRSNDAGNFSREHFSIEVPYTAKLVYEGRERPMVMAQTELSCNSCHAQTGLNSAPGRIVAP